MELTNVGVRRLHLSLVMLLSSFVMILESNMAQAEPVVVQDSYGGTTEKIVSAFEERLGARLPADYRAFLLKWNGGVFRREAIHARASVVVSDVFGLAIGGVRDVERMADLVSDRLDKHLVPIASTPTGDLIAMSVRKRDFGSVYWWKHDVRKNNLILLNPDFTTFWNELKLMDPLPPESDSSFIRLAELGDSDGLMAAIAKGANVNEVDSIKETALLVAAWRCEDKCLEALLSAGADLNMKSAQGSTALHLACRSGWLDGSKRLLDRGAKLEANDKRGYTPIMCAVLSCNDRLVRELIRRGAKLDCKGHDGKTLRDLCENPVGRDKILPIVTAAQKEQTRPKE